MKSRRLLVVGAGLTGAALARSLAEAGHQVLVIEERDHLAGNCHTRRDPATGIMVHVYGPHIFHTDRPRVWDFVGRFADFQPCRHRVKTTAGGRVYSLPINLLTLNQFFGRAMNPAEARKFVAELVDRSIAEPANFEERALSMLGRELYETFFYGFSKKQWGREPRELPASILQRLPVRFNYEDSYFDHPWQAIPADGYTALVENMLDLKGVEVAIGTAYEPALRRGRDHVFYTGPLDRYFDWRAGPLPYRTLDFEWFFDDGDHQGCPVMNYADPGVPWTRIVEHKHFAPWESHPRTIGHREYVRAAGPGDPPFYPVRFAGGSPLLDRYLELAQAERGVTFAGRLGTFSYLDMDAALAGALDTADLFLENLARGRPMPALLPDTGRQ